MPAMSCPKCGRNALFHSRRQRTDGLLRLLIFSAVRCRVCGHRHFRINALAVAAMAAVLLALATLVGAGEAAWTHHAQVQVQGPPIASAQVVGSA